MTNINGMVVAAQNQASFIVVASVIILTSAFSLKSFSTTGMFKVEEWVAFKGNSANSKLLKPEKRLRHKMRAHFVICNHCFWCASQIITGKAPDSCPNCKKSNLETIPVFLDEAYFFYCDEKRGVDLSFRKDNGTASSSHL